MRANLRFKLLKVLTVCLVTLGVLAPAILTFGLIFEEHINIQEARNFVYELSNNSKGDRHYTPNRKTTKSHKETESLNSCSALTEQLLPAEQSDLLKFIFFVLPSGVCLAIFLYDRYCVYRTALLKEQIEMLERLWQQSMQR